MGWGKGGRGAQDTPLLAAGIPLGLHHALEKILRGPHKPLAEITNAGAFVNHLVKVSPHLTISATHTHTHTHTQTQ